MVQSNARRLERLPTVLARTGMGRSWIYREIAAGRFPQPVKIGRASGWDSTELDRWLDIMVASTAQKSKVH